MDELIEFILDVIFELGIEASESKKVPKWLRCTLKVLIEAIFIVVILSLLVFGLLTMEDNWLFGSFLIILGIAFIYLGIKKYNDLRKK